jgi:hypothetical protein
MRLCWAMNTREDDRRTPSRWAGLVTPVGRQAAGRGQDQARSGRSPVAGRRPGLRRVAARSPAAGPALPVPAPPAWTGAHGVRRVRSMLTQAAPFGVKVSLHGKWGPCQVAQYQQHGTEQQ